jgi:peptidoglycan/LPS O-acetylase OafA/YrhL
VLGWNNYLHGDLGVDIFVILSGLGLALSPSYPGFWPFLQRRLRRVMPTYWLVLTAAILCNTHFLQLHYTPANILLHYLGIHAWFGDAYAMSISDSFWFITLILSLYLLYAGLRQLLATPEKLLLAGGVITVTVSFAFFLTGQSGAFGHVALRIPGFFLGLLLGQLLRTGRLELSVGSVLALAGFVLVYVPYTRGIVFHTMVAGLSLMGLYVLVLRPSLDRTAPGVTRTLKFFGDYSLEIFLVHQLLIRDYNVYLHGRWFNVPLPTPGSLIVGMLAAMVVTLLLSVELQRLLRRLLPI